MAVHDHKCNYCSNKAYAKNGSGLDRVFLCFNHWKNRKAKEWTKNQSETKKEIAKKTGSTNKDFLMPLIQKAPNNCQCCGDSLAYWKKTNNPLICAHILEKRKPEFYIIATNRQNIVFLCDGCHNGFDNIGFDWFDKQKNEFKELIFERVKYLSNYLTESQKCKIKDYLVK